MSSAGSVAAPVGHALPAVVDLERLASLALDTARAAGADAAEAGVSVDRGLSVNVRKGEVDTLEHHRDRGLAVTVYFGRCKGSASTGDFSEAAVRDAVESACAIARYTSDDPAHGLADSELMARDFPDLDLDHPWPLEADDAIELARECEAAAVEADSRITNIEGSGVSAQRGLRVYANSHGFVGRVAATSHGINCVAVAGERDTMQRDYWYTVARSPDDLEDVQAVGQRAARRAVARLGARRVATERVPVLFDPQTARSMIGHLVGAVRGSALYRQASFLLDAAGRRIFPEWMEVVERPRLARGMGSAVFDAEGVATRESPLVAGGVLQRYILDSYSARRLGLQTTGNAGGVHNLQVTPGDDDFDALLRRMGRGLVVTELMGQGVNLVTGDYSRGAAGFWVEDGGIAYPVQEVTVAGSLPDIFDRLVAAGCDVDRRGNIQTGSLLVDGMTVAGE